MTLIFIVNGHISSIIAFSDYVTTSNKDAAGKRLEEMQINPNNINVGWIAQESY